MNRLKAFIEKNVQGWKVLSLFVLTNMVYGLMLAVTIPETMAFANGMKLLDMMPLGYDLEYVIELFSALGVQGRSTYLTCQIPVDMVYPFLFGCSYSLLFGYLLKKLNRLDSLLFYACALPILAGTADYLENIGIIVLLNTYPDVMPIEVQLTMLCSLTKSLTTSLYFILLIIVLIWLGLNLLLKSKKT